MADKETIIGPQTRVSGELRGEEDVVVRGRVEGRVNLSSTFTVEDGAIVQANVEARIILISGVVVGNLNARESIRLAERARVVGDIVAPRVIMEEGATYKGRLDMGPAAELRGETRAETRAEIRAEPRPEVSAEAQAEGQGEVRADMQAEAGDDRAQRSPPRLTVPSRVAATPDATVTRIADAAPPPRVASAMPGRPGDGPPSLPGPEEAAAGGVASAPAWAKKKLHRRT